MLDLHSVIFHKIFARRHQPFPVPRNHRQIKTRPAKAAFIFFDSILTMPHRSQEKALHKRKTSPQSRFGNVCASQTQLLTCCHPEEVRAFARRRAADEGSMYSSPSFHYLRLRMTNRSKTLYTGVIGNLEKRVFEHKQGIKGNSLRATRSTGWCILSVLGISALRPLARNRSKDLHESRKWH